MKKKNKAFTLIELLAILVILLIIALITVPIIVNIVKRSKREAAVRSAYGFIDAINKKYMSTVLGEEDNTMDGTYAIVDGKITGGIYTNGEIEVSGSVPTTGSLTYIDDELQSGCLVINGYEVRYQDGRFTSEGKGNCGQTPSPEEPTQNTPDPEPQEQEQIIQPEITLGTSISTTNSISIEFTITDSGTSGIKTTTCKTISPSEITGTIDNNTCTINGLAGNTTYTYQVSTETNSGGTDTKTGSKKTIDPLEGVQGTDGAIYLTYDYIVYYNPVTNSACTESDYKQDNSNLGYNGLTNGGASASASRTAQTANQTGCLKWYLYSYKGNYANLILDHNITGGSSSWGIEYITQSDFQNSASSMGITYECTNSWGVAYSDDGYSTTCRGPITALKFLKNQTSNWTTMTPKIPNSSSSNEESTTEDIQIGWNSSLQQIDYTHYTINYNNYKARMLSGSEFGNIHQIFGIGNGNAYPNRFKVNFESGSANGEYWVSSGNDLKHAVSFIGSTLYGDYPAYYNIYDVFEYKYAGIRPVITVTKSSVIPE